jgi:4-alpha-glucanotransferase
MMHISCLPGGQGIGCFDEHAYQFIDFLGAAGIQFWQVCPLTPTGYGDSPYQGLSSFALNPYFVNLRELDIDISFENLNHHPDRVSFGEIYSLFQGIQGKISQNFPRSERDNLQHFRRSTPWLRPYALFVALKQYFQGKAWSQWPKPYREYAKIRGTQLPPSVLSAVESQEILQYLAHQQWQKLKHYAQEKGVKIIGDIPIYPGFDSADVWSEPKNFQLDGDLNPTRIAGVPPDYFSENGQLWGNPLYDWSFLGKNNYDWWRRRIARNGELFDVLRLDHFRGFERYWSVPQGAGTARNGRWEKGPGEKLFYFLGDKPFIAEDLGELDENVPILMEKLHFPGMKVLQFAFSNDAGNIYLPHYHKPFSVLYLGTHDNDTLLGWYGQLDPSTKDQIRRYFAIGDQDVSWKFLTEIYRSPCFLGIICVQDLLQLGSEGRFNTPGTEHNNWQWRMTESQFSTLKSRAAQLRDYGILYNRNSACNATKNN